MSMDQLLFAPTFLGCVYVYNGLLDGHSIEQVKEKMLGGYSQTLLTNYSVWPLVQIANFGLVPPHYQQLVVNSVGIVWNAYLSHRVQ
jgi:protein Mpv17